MAVDPRLLPSPLIASVSSVESFIDAVSMVADAPHGTTLAAVRLCKEFTDELPRSAALASALYVLANLSMATQMISLCHLDGRCTGAALALALTCDVVTVTPLASMSASWEEPAAAAVHARGAERVGAVACERRLFDRICEGPEAAECGLASFICEDFEAALNRCGARIRTIHATARAARLAWPFSKNVAFALSEPFGTLD